MRSFSAMVTVLLLLALAALAAAGVAGTLRALRTDGARRIPTDPDRGR